MFRKTPKLRFACLIPGIVKSMPIIPSNQVSYEWQRKAVEAYKREKESLPPGESLKHIVRCPGISMVSRNGWVQRSYQDIYLKTDDAGFQWKTPIDQPSLNKNHEFLFPYIGHHSGSLLEPYGLLKENTLPTIIKINSPWIVYVPKGYYLLTLPIPYSDDSRFTSTIGLLDGDYGPVSLNVQLYWHRTNSEEIIPAGTPLAQYFLVKKEKIDVAVEEYNDSDLENLRTRRTVAESKFIAKYSKLKEIFWR